MTGRINILFIIFLMGIISMSEGKTQKSSISKTPADQEVLDAVYSGKKYPAGFTVSSDSGLFVIYTGENVKDKSSYYWKEYSAKTKNEAEKKAGNYITLSNPGHSLKSGIDTDSYYEFLETYADGSVSKRLRVHKASYIENVSYNWSSGKDIPLNDLSGLIVNFRPIDSQSVTALFDYLWLNRFASTEGACMISRETKESSKSTVYTSLSTHSVFGDWGLQDEIYLIKSVFEVNRQTGQVKISHKILKKIIGKRQPQPEIK